VSPEIRPAGPADAPVVAALHADSWLRTYRGMLSDAYLDGDVHGERLAVWQQRFAEPRPDQRAWLAVADGEPVGFVCLFADDDPQWGVYVDNLHVRGDQQGRGLGRTLLATAAEWTIAERPGSGLWLWVLEANHAGRAFYRRTGAVEADRTLADDHGGGTATAVRCHWPDPQALLS
jgi:GNAT superfamily N-acetyltransferase